MDKSGRRTTAWSHSRINGVGATRPTDSRFAEAGGGFIAIASDPVDWVPRPPLVAQVRNSYGLYVTGDSMMPELEPGDIALVNPHLPLIPDTTCIFYRATQHERRATIKRLRRLSDDLVSAPVESAGQDEG